MDTQSIVLFYTLQCVLGALLLKISKTLNTNKKLLFKMKTYFNHCDTSNLIFVQFIIQGE